MLKIFISLTVVSVALIEAELSSDKSGIVFGERVPDKEIYPYMVRVKALADNQECIYDELLQIKICAMKRNSFKCGGSIITKNAVITAGHCLQFSVVLNIEVRAGCKTESCSSLQVRQRCYGTVAKDADIGMIYVETPFTFGDYVNAIALPNADYTVNSTALILGWGLDENGETPPYLKKTHMRLLSRAECIYEVNKVFIGAPYISLTEMCGLHHDNNTEISAVCSGDSGGPVVDNHNQMLSGVVAWGAAADNSVNRDRKTCHTDAPSVFVNVFKNMHWINESLVVLGETAAWIKQQQQLQ